MNDRPGLDIRPMERDRLNELLQLRWPDSNMIICGRFVRPEDVEGIGGDVLWLPSGRDPLACGLDRLASGLHGEVVAVLGLERDEPLVL